MKQKGAVLVSHKVQRLGKVIRSTINRYCANYRATDNSPPSTGGLLSLPVMGYTG